MAIFNLSSKRQADAAKSGAADVYQYDDIPSRLRVQVHQIALQAIGKVGSHGGGYMGGTTENSWWQELERIYLRAKGLHGLARDEFAGQRVLNFIWRTTSARSTSS